MKTSPSSTSSRPPVAHSCLLLSRVASSMVLTDRQRADLHAGIYEYLQSRGDAYQKVVEALAQADPECTIPHTTTTSNGSSAGLTKTPLLEKKWTAIPRLQKKVLELERQASHHAKIHAHRSAAGSGGGALEANDGAGGARRLLPRLPCQHTLQGHSSVVTCVRVHPVFTVVVSGSEDGSVKVGLTKSSPNSISFDPLASREMSRDTATNCRLSYKTSADSSLFTFFSFQGVGSRKWRIHTNTERAHQHCQWTSIYPHRITFGVVLHRSFN